MDFNINLTLLGVILLTLLLLIQGFKKGMAKEVSGLVALIAGLFVLAVGLMIYTSFLAGRIVHTVFAVILLIVFGIVYGIVRLVLRSAKAVSRLPILNFLDSVMGSVVGVGESLIMVWIVFLLCENNLLGAATEYIRSDISQNTFLTLVYDYNFFIR